MISITVKTSGGLFRFEKPQFERALRGAIQEIVEKGEEHLGEMLRPRPAGVFLSVGEAKRGKASVGTFRRSMHGDVPRSTLGRIFVAGPGAIYGPWLEGTGSRNQTTRFKGYSSFRKTAQWLDKEKGGVLRAHVGRLVKGLN